MLESKGCQVRIRHQFSLDAGAEQEVAKDRPMKLTYAYQGRCWSREPIVNDLDCAFDGERILEDFGAGRYAEECYQADPREPHRLLTIQYTREP